MQVLYQDLLHNGSFYNSDSKWWNMIFYWKFHVIMCDLCKYFATRIQSLLIWYLTKSDSLVLDWTILLSDLEVCNFIPVSCFGIRPVLSVETIFLHLCFLLKQFTIQEISYFYHTPIGGFVFYLRLVRQKRHKITVVQCGNM